MVASCWSTTTRAESRVPPTAVATTYVSPFVSEVTRPVLFTVAIAGTRLTHVYVVGTMFSAASREIAPSVVVAPMAVRVASCGVIAVATIAPAAKAVTVSGDPASGEPASPKAVAVRLCWPTMVPSVHEVLARPAVSVVTAAAERAPALTAKLTLLPATPLP